jgi:penicillin-binding protein 1A
MSRLLQEITREGTAARAQATLKRSDIYGKTGTTNDAIDTWFAGYHPTVTAIVWMGYDQPKSLGDRETGGGLSLPVWISFMEAALKGVPVMEPAAPEGVVNVGGEWYYEEYARGRGVSSLGLDPGTDPGAKPQDTNATPYDRNLMNSEPPKPAPAQAAPAGPAPPTEERRSILDLFRN